MSAKQLTAVIILLSLLSLASWLWLSFTPQAQVTELNVIIPQQAANLEKKLKALTANQASTVQQFQESLKAFVQLPLPTRGSGKDNPFQKSVAQQNQFSQPSGASPATSNNPLKK